MRIGVVTPWDVEDPQSWSGVVQPMVTALEKVGEVVPFVTNDVPDALLDRGLARLLDGRLGKRYLVGHTLGTSWRRGRSLQRRLRRSPVDVLICIAASQDIALLRTNIPIIQVSDTSFAAIKDFYPLFTNLNLLSALQAHVQAALSARRASHTLAATEWAKNALIRDDGIPSEHITVAPFGPAISTERKPSGPAGPLRLLMVSSDWERKGGPNVIAVAEELRRRGVDFELTVVGDAPELPSWVRMTGRIPRSEIASAYESADVLLDLATSNAAGVVLTDAANAGLPVVATDTGGVSTIVRDGQTGFLVQPGDVQQAADRLAELADPELRQRMGQSASHYAQDVLNWSAWAQAASVSINKVLKRDGTDSATSIVAFSPAIPYPGIEHAGGQYLRRLQEALTGSRRVTWVTQDRPSVRHAFRQPGVVTDVLLLADQQHPRKWRRRAYSLADRFETLAHKIDSQPVPLGPLLDLLTRKDLRTAIRSADVLDFQWAAWTRLAPLARLLNRRATVTFTFHDVMSQKCAREAAKAPDTARRVKWRFAGFLARRWEKRALTISDTAMVFSEKDRALLDPSQGHNVVVIHPPLAEGHMPTHVPEVSNRVLLVGYMARQENVDALQWFTDEIWPGVRQQVPDAQLHVVGGSLSQQVARHLHESDAGIIYRGFVDDLDAEYAAANVVVVPLRHGAGVKFKTIEALLAGVPVVTTPIGAEGIGGPALFQGYTSDAAEFAACVAKVLKSERGPSTRSQQAALWSKYSTSHFKTVASRTYL